MYKNDINSIWTTKDEVEFVEGLGMHGVGRDGKAMEGRALLEYQCECLEGYIEGARHREWRKIDGSLCVFVARKRLNQARAQLAEGRIEVAA